MNAGNSVNPSPRAKIDGLYADFRSAASVLRDTNTVGQLTGIIEGKGGDLSSFYALLDTVEAYLHHKSYTKPFFVVVEGLDGSGKTTLVRSLAKEFQQQHPNYIVRATGTPPASLSAVRDAFDACDSLVTRAFYMVSNYVLQHEMLVEATNTDKQCIYFIDRYYGSTCAYSVAWKNTLGDESAIDALPQHLFNWPTDLLSPHLILGLMIDELTRSRRVTERGKINNRNPWDERLSKDCTLGRRIMRALMRSRGTSEFAAIDASMSKEEVFRQATEKIINAFDRFQNPANFFRTLPLQCLRYTAAQHGLCDWLTGLRGKHQLWHMQVAVSAVSPAMKTVGVHKVDDGGILFFSCKNDAYSSDQCGSPVACSIISIFGGYPREQQWRGEGFLVNVSDKEADLLGLSPPPSLSAHVSASIYFDQTQNHTERPTSRQERETLPDSYDQVVDQMRKSPLPADQLKNLACFRFVPLRMEQLRGTPSARQEHMRRYEWKRNEQGWTSTRCIMPFTLHKVLPKELKNPRKPITLAITGTHCAGKETIGKEVARVLGWKFHGELGDSLRKKQELIPGGLAFGDGTASQPDNNTSWDEFVFEAELARDRGKEGSRVVETWHFGNLGWLFYRTRDCDGEKRRRFRNMISERLESENSHSVVMFVHLRIPSEVSERRHGKEENASRLPMVAETTKRDILHLHEALDVEVEEHLRNLKNPSIPMLMIDNSKDGPKAISDTARRVVEFVSAHLWRTAIN